MIKSMKKTAALTLFFLALKLASLPAFSKVATTVKLETKSQTKPETKIVSKKASKSLSKAIAKQRLAALKKKRALLNPPEKQIRIVDVDIPNEKLKEFLKVEKEVLKRNKALKEELAKVSSSQARKRKKASHQQEINKYIQRDSKLSIAAFNQISKIARLNEKFRQRLARLKD